MKVLDAQCLVAGACLVLMGAFLRGELGGLLVGMGACLAALSANGWRIPGKDAPKEVIRALRDDERLSAWPRLKRFIRGA